MTDQGFLRGVVWGHVVLWPILIVIAFAAHMTWTAAPFILSWLFCLFILVWDARRRKS